MIQGIRSAVLPALAGLLVFAAAADAQTPADSAQIREAALDYIEGWYEGDAERMERALHPDLVRRSVFRFGGGEDDVVETNAERLIEQTGKGGGTSTPPEARRTDVRILDIFEKVASVRVDADRWIDYMHLVRLEGRWLILNVLWETRPEEGC